MLEFDDIQHLLLTRAPALAARYEFLSFRDGAGGRAWVSAIKETIHSAASMRAGVDQDKRWVTAAFTWNGLRALGLDEASLASFPEEFKQGMAARAEMLGDDGLNAPEHWVGGLASPDLHAIVILFARDEAEHDRCVSEHEKLIASCPGVEVLSVLDLQGHSAVWLRARAFWLPRPLSQPVDRGKRRGTHARLRRAVEAGRVHPWLPRRTRRHSRQPAAGNSRAERQLHGLPQACRACGEVSRLPSPARRDRGGAGTDRGQADGALAQRRAARARRPTRTIPSSGPIRNETTTSTTRRWTRTAMRSRSARTFAPHESARHCGTT